MGGEKMSADGCLCHVNPFLQHQYDQRQTVASLVSTVTPTACDHSAKTSWIHQTIHPSVKEKH